MCVGLRCLAFALLAFYGMARWGFPCAGPAVSFTPGSSGIFLKRRKYRDLNIILPPSSFHGQAPLLIVWRKWKLEASYNAHHMVMVRTARSQAATAAATGGTWEIDNRRHLRDGQFGLSLSLSIPNSFTTTKRNITEDRNPQGNHKKRQSSK